MSLVITSNISLDDKPDTSQVFKPYSYQNRLLNTMRIPANSDRANANFNHYFGVPIGTATAPDITYSTQTPFPAVIGKGELFNAGGKAERNVEDLAKDIQSGINAAAFNPVLIQSSTPKGIVVSVEVDATTNSFKGFKFVATQNSATTKRTGAVDGALWTDVSMNKAKPPASQANGQVVGGVNGFHVVNKEYPLSQAKKSCVLEWGGMNTGDQTSPWVAGLTRINRETSDKNGNVVERPQYFNSGTKLGIEAQNTIRLPRAQGQAVYCDVGIGRIGELLWVWQNGCASNTSTATQAIKYWGAHNATFTAAPYNLRTNPQGYNAVRYTLENEHMIIEIGDYTKGTYVLLADYFTTLAAGGTKGNMTAPICAPKMALYPVVACSTGTGKTATMVELSAYTNYPSWTAATYTNYDFWGYSQSTMLTQWCFDIEKRFWNRISVVTGGINGDGLLIPIKTGTSTGDYYSTYESRIITAPSIEYGEQITNNATAGRLLGFQNDPVSEPLTNVAGLQTTFSTSVPVLVGDVSLFIRLNNFTQNSINARQGTLSKIVGHLPRFDNSGNETGGLYFEPNEKTYISLGNTDEILINSFDIDIVYDNETLCTALSGKTIVVFHIRKARV
mgnify:CR=1 FL=1